MKTNSHIVISTRSLVYRNDIYGKRTAHTHTYYVLCISRTDTRTQIKKHDLKIKKRRRSDGATLA